jgi:signal transduction histidine kinase/HAMP domain-containing protein/ActR/RegA family two-component response regulator
MGVAPSTRDGLRDMQWRLPRATPQTTQASDSRIMPSTAVPKAVDPFDLEVLLGVLSDVKGGDFTARMPGHWIGLEGKVADRLNEIIGANQALEGELERVSRVVGKEGKLSQRVTFRGTDQVWGSGIESVNSLIEDLVRPSNEMQRVIGAVAGGDLSKKVSADVQGEMLELKNTINGMVDQLNGFISEVTRVAREVGTEGKLGQAAAVTIEVGGVWKELTDNVNLMAGNLTGQVRDIAEVTTAVANGDLSKKITADVRGEFLQLKNTVNAMVDQLNRFAGEVTRVAREVGVEGKLGGQAQSQEVAGVWKDLTDDVNQLAANLTNQVRAIAEVATAVTEGDLTRQVGVEASGEVAVLKDKLNEMIRNLRETMRQNTEQDWLKTNLERFTRMLQGQRDLATVSNMILSDLTPLVSAQHGVFYALMEPEGGGEPVLQFQAGYGFKERKNLSSSFRLGEGLVGQCALEKERILLTEAPADYIQISSGLGEARPLNIIVLPILFEGSVRAVIELASFSAFSPTHQSLLDQLTESIGLVLNTVAAQAVSDKLLEQSQTQAKELQSRQEQLHQSNADLAEQAALLADKNDEVEAKYQEVEEAKRFVEEKAKELSVSSRYKSEFIANMSHELRTPLNSLLVLAEQLEDNPDGNLTPRQVQFAHVIRSSGVDLLRLLNDILDLAKVESNTVQLEFSELPLADLYDTMVQTFQPVSDGQELEFVATLDPELPATMTTDPHRLRQVLKNLLGNAFKFTERGQVSVRLELCTSGWSPRHAGPRRRRSGHRPDRQRHRHRHQGRAAGVDVRGVRPGRRVDRAQVRRNRSRPLDKPQPRRAARRGDHAGERVRNGQHVHRLPPAQGRTRRRRRGQPAHPRRRRGAERLPPAPARERRATPAERQRRDQGRARGPGQAALPAPGRSRGLRAGRRGRGGPGRRTGQAPRTVNREGFYGGVAAGATILVVDDDFRNIFALSALLERGNLNVVVAESGADALAIFDQRSDIDIVLMDIMMPGMNGYETMEALRKRPELADLPIIAVTGKVVGGERERCIAAGASDYIPKPVDTEELLQALSQWFPEPDPTPLAT